MRANRLIAGAVVALAACVGNPPPGLLDGGTGDLVWPLPPEPARISYVGQVASERDLGKESSFFARLKNGLLGVDEQGLLTRRPFDTFVDEAGRVYVTNGALPALLVLDPLNRDAWVLAPEGPGALGKPMGISGDRAGRLYVTDPVQRRVVALDYQGEFVEAYGGPDILLNPTDVAVSPEGDRVYVADSYLHQIVIFGRDGRLIRRIGRHEGELAAKDERKRQAITPVGHDSEPSDVFQNRGIAEGEFRFPAFVEVAPSGILYVSDGVNFRVQAFDRDGRFLRTIGRHGDTPGSLARPKGVAVDSEGHLYVADAAFNNVQIFDDRGRLLLAFGGLGTGPGALWQPLGLSIDSGDRIYIADRYNDRVQVYQYHALSGDAASGDALSPTEPPRDDGPDRAGAFQGAGGG